MRWICLTLLLLNLLVFAVQWFDVNGSDSVSLLSVEEAERAEAPLKLLREHVDGRQSNLSAEAPPASHNKVAEPLCIMIGPAESQAAAQRIMALFQDNEIPSKIITNEVKKMPDYWVYLPPLDSRNAAIKKLRELQQVNKIDSFLISQGPLANGISLGLFKTLEAATELQQERARQGLNAKLAEVERTAAEYWVVATAPSAIDINIKIASSLTKNGIDVEPRQIFCKSVASN